MIAHKYSMTTSTLTSIVLRYLFFGVMMFTIITTISENNAPSTTYGNYESQVKEDNGHLKVESEIVTDYVDWSPSPIFGGGRAGLIPH